MKASAGGRLLLPVFLLASSARAGSSFDVAVDPRVELLGVVQRLAGHGEASDADAGYLRDVDARFAGFKEHPAVRLYGQVYRRDALHDSFGIELLYYSAPPELALALKSARLPYVENEDEQQIAQRFLWELRDFAASSDFRGFFNAHAELYRGAEARVRRELIETEPIARLEAYLGVSLESRCHYYVPLLYFNRRHSSFIEPYPDPRSAGPVVGPFEVWTLVPREDPAASGQGGSRRVLWHEPLYVFIDPSVHYFESAEIPDPADFYGSTIAACRKDAINCVKRYLVAAVVERLNRAVGPPDTPIGAGADYRPTVEALAARLKEYEEHRDRYPTLWDFYPRLFSVFHELAFPAGPAGPAGPAFPLRLPDAGPVRRATDFFSPEFRKRAAGERR